MPETKAIPFDQRWAAAWNGAVFFLANGTNNKVTVVPKKKLIMVKK